MQKKIQRPENWQDFESLCKMLWGEIWQCDEIQKNGRSGQSQNGVDVYGIPVNEVAYYGIQCKGKDEYINVNFTTNEIDIELAKALTHENSSIYNAVLSLVYSAIQSGF